jgi:hypothetical protein
MPRCAGLTISGERCMRNVRNGTHCATHAAAAVPAYFDESDLRKLNSANLRDQQYALLALNRIRTAEDAETLVRANVLPRILFLLFNSDQTSIKDKALWILINLTSVPGDVGARAILRAQPDFFAQMLELTLTENAQIAENLFWCLANISAGSVAYSRMIIDLEFPTTCVVFLRDGRAPRSLLKFVAFLLSNLSQHMTVEEARETMTEISYIPNIVLTNQVILLELLWAINRLYLKCHTLSRPIALLLIDNLDIQSSKLMHPAINTISDICSSDDSELIECLVECGLLPKLNRMLLRPTFKPIVLLCLSNIAIEERGSIALMEEPGLLLNIISLMNQYKDAVWTLSNLATRGAAAIIPALIRHGGALSKFTQDNFATLEMRIKKVVLEGFMNLLSRGGADAYVMMRGSGVFTVLPAEHDDGEINSLLIRIRALAEPYSHFEPPVAAALVREENDPLPVSSAATVAEGRMYTELSRGSGSHTVNVADLLFTAADVAHLTGRGFIFRRDGTLAAPS